MKRINATCQLNIYDHNTNVKSMFKANEYLHMTPTTALGRFLCENAYLNKRFCSGNFQLFIAPGISTVFRKFRALCKKWNNYKFCLIVVYSSPYLLVLLFLLRWIERFHFCYAYYIALIMINYNSSISYLWELHVHVIEESIRLNICARI